MMNSVHQCVEEIDYSNITVKEKGRRANFRNPDKAPFRRIKIDGCLVNDGARADWIVTKIGIGSVIIELKGKDVEHACRQLFDTLENSDCCSWIERKRALLVVCSRYPAFGTTVSKNQEAARKRGLRLHVVCGQGDFTIESVLGVASATAKEITTTNGSHHHRKSRRCLTI